MRSARAARAFIDWLAAGRASASGRCCRSVRWAQTARRTGLRSDDAGNTALIDRSEAADPDAARDEFAEFCATQQRWLDDYALFAALSARARRVRPGGRGQRALRDRDPEALRAAKQRLERRAATRCASRSGSSRCSGAHCATCACARRCDCSATCRSTSRPIRSRRGRSARSSSCDADGVPTLRRRRAAGLFFRGRPVVGQSALRLGAGAPRWLRVLARAHCGRGCTASTCCASIIFAAWRLTGRCRPVRPPRAKANGCRRRRGAAARAAARACARSAAGGGGSRRDHAGGRWRCAARFALPGMRVLQFGFDGAGAIRICPQLHAATPSSTPARTTTTRRSAGIGRSIRPRQRVDVYLGSDRQSMPAGAAARRAGLGRRARDGAGAGPAGSWAARRASTRPARSTNNWCWRMAEGALTAALATQYLRLNETFGRNA